jgi:hypothetical protein
MTYQTCFEKALFLIDQANSEDPNSEEWQGKNYPKEQLYAERMFSQMQLFCPEASEVLQIAARAQHIQRWVLKRKDFPEGPVGYKHWRTTQGKFHAETTAKLMLEAGYQQIDADRVMVLLQKKQLKHDPEVQTLEDVICLVFLEFYLNPFAAKHSEDKMLSIIQKTWKKMSTKGHDAALKLPFTDDMLALVKKALS